MSDGLTCLALRILLLKSKPIIQFNILPIYRSPVVVAVKSEPQPSPPLPTFAQVITSDAENPLKMFSPKLTGLTLFQNGYKYIPL